ncbi:MAG: hypothetical protein LDLANPLL_00246 [Turneriella sp.]|nr:hypothetical protein [Turneriella sp.]
MFYTSKVARAAITFFLPFTLLNAKDEDIASAKGSLSVYFSSRSMSFAPLSNGDQIRVATLETVESTSGYSSDTKYQINSEKSSHTLAELGTRGRIYSSRMDKAAPMANFEADLLIGSSFEFLQTRLMGDYGIMFNPLPSFYIGPAVGGYYSYFGSNLLVSSNPSYSDTAGKKNDVYLLRNAANSKSYLLTIGPHNLGLYAGLYVDFTAFGFLELSAAAMAVLLDIPLEINSELNSLSDKGTSIGSQAIQKWNDWKPMMLDARITLKLSYLGVDFKTPLIVGYRAFYYPSLGLTEKGVYFGAVLIHD